MKSIIEKNSEDKGRKIFTRVLVVIFIFIMVIGSVVLINNEDSEPNNEKKNYTFFLGDEQMNEIMGCENYWHYENMSGLIPCEVNKTVGGVVANWSLSPEENCAFYNGTFIGLNAKNITRARELYLALTPKCWTLNDTDISNEWISTNKCVCLDNCGDNCFEGNYSFIENCKLYDCGGGLIIKEDESTK
jgi:hypothetical protein